MKRLAIVLAVLSLLALAQVGQAVELHSDWYVNIADVALFGYDQQHRLRGTDWSFTGSLGPAGPFLTSDPHQYSSQRLVTVPQTVADVPPGTSLYLWGEPEDAISWDITNVVLCWETNYDASQMRLELYKYSIGHGFTLLWSQSQSGNKSDFPNVLQPWQRIEVGSVPVFRVMAVPEPNGLLILLAGAGTTFGLLRRRS